MSQLTTSTDVPETATPSRSLARFRLGPVVTTALGIGILLALTVLATSTLSSYNIFVFNSCLLAAIGAIALNLQMGTAGQISMGNSGFLLLGAFATAALTTQGLDHPWSIVVATLVSGVFGLLAGIPAARISGMYFALSTVAAFYIFHYVANRYQAAEVGEAGFLIPPIFTGLPKDLQSSWSWLLVVVLSVVVVMAAVLTRGKFGRALRMIRDHEAAAPAFGIGVMRYKLAVFFIGFSMIGLQGSLYAYYYGQVTVDSFSMLMAIQFIAMIIIGGMDSVVGAVIGAFIVTMLPPLTTDVLSRAFGEASSAKGPQAALIIYGILVIIFVTRSSGGLVSWVRNARSRLAKGQGA